MDSSRTLVYWCFLILGISSLLPWNLYMTAHQYFSYKLRNTTTWPSNSSSPSGNYTLTPLQRTFETYLTASGSAIAIAGAICNTLLTARFKNGVRVSLGHLFVFIPLLPTIALAWIDTDQEQIAFFIGTLLLGNLANFAANGFVGGGAMGLAARFPTELMQAVMLGQAVAGVLVSLGSIISQATTPGPILNGLVYFISAVVWTGISQTAYMLLVRSRFAHEMVAVADANLLSNEDDEPLLGDENDFPGYGGEENDDYDWSKPLELRHSHLSTAPFFERLKAVISEIKYEALAIIVCYTATLSIFPSLTSLVVSTSTNESWQKYFTPVACFLVFNCGDATGRLLSKWIRYPRSSKGLLVMVVVRLVFIPMLFLCNVQPRFYTRSLFESDAIFILLLALYAISNGLIVSLAAMYGSERADASIKELAGSVLTTICSTGVLLGSLLSLLIVNLV